MQHRDPRGIPTREEERELIRRAQGGDTEARNELVVRHRPYVVRTVSRWAQERRDIKDLIAEGEIAFMAAIKDFDLSLPFRLCTYATPKIIAAMQRWVIANPVIRVPAWLASRKDIRDAEAWQDKPPHWQAMAAAARQAMQTPFPLRTIRSIKEDQADYDPRDDRSPPADAELERADEIDRLFHHLERLPAREREILCRRFGIGCKAEGLEAVGRRFGFSRERTRQIEARGLKRIRRNMESEITLLGIRNAFIVNYLRRFEEAENVVA